MTNNSSLGTLYTIWAVISLSTLTTVSSITNTKSFLLKRYPYLDWIRSPTPLNVYPKIFQRIIPRDLGRTKKSATSHSTNWGKRSSGDNQFHVSQPIYPHEMQRFKIPWNIIQRGLKRSSAKGQVEVAKRMWMPDQEVHQPAIRRRQVEKNGNEKKEGSWRGSTDVISSRMFNKHYKRLRKPRIRNGKSLSERAAQLFFLTKQPIIGKKRKRRIGMIQKAKIFEDEEFPFNMPYHNNKNCHLLDKLSQKLCLYILKSSAEKFHSLCAGGCFTEENAVDYKKREGGEKGNLNGGTGKKFRKIFVRI